MSLPAERVVNALVRYKEKKRKDAATARPGQITVSLGKIVIRSTENRYPTITVKPSDITGRPKAPKGNGCWLSLDCVQNVEAKYNYINFQVVAGSSMAELVDVLSFAWAAPEPRRSALFKDNADEIARPVHSRAPNAKPAVAAAQSSMAGGGGRNTKPRVICDPEGSAAAHPDFSNDFNGGSSSNQPRKKVQPVHNLQKLFGDYGIGDKSSDEPPQQVHMNPPNVNAPPVASVKPQKKIEPISYAAQGRRSDNKYSPVDKKQPERSDGIGEGSFYGSNGNPKLAQRTTPLSAARSGTKDSLDAARTSALRSSRLNSIADEGHRRTQSSSQVEKDYDLENVQPESSPDKWMTATKKQPYKSLTSTSASSAFDATVRKPNSTSSSSTANSRPKLASSSSYYANGSSKVGSNPSSSSSMLGSSVWKRDGYSDYGGGCNLVYKSQQNIGNSCYMNATMQVLAACPIFVSQLDRAYRSLRHHSEPIRLFHTMMRWLTGQYTSTDRVAWDLLEKMRTQLMTLDKVFEEGDGKAQQDAEEALTAMLGAVSDECTGKGFRKRDSMPARQSLGGGEDPTKTPKTPNPVKRPEEGESPMDAPASTTPTGDGEKKEKMPADCDPVDLMEVKWRDVRKCANCGNVNLREAAEHRLHVIVGEAEKKDEPWTVKCVEELLAKVAVVKEIITDYGCESCKKKKITAVGTTEFVRFGEYIIIVLKRFGYDENWKLRKLTMPIRVPMYLEMANYIAPDVRPNESHLLNETIEIEDREKSVKKERKKDIKKTEVNSKVMNGTNEWAEVSSDDEKMPAASGEEGENMEEEGEETMKDDGEEKKRKEQEVIHISSSSSDSQALDLSAAATVAGAAAAAASEQEGVTPPTTGVTTRRGLRLETPATVQQAETRRRSEVQQQQHVTTPTARRKRGRCRPSRGGKDEERLSTGSSRRSLSDSREDLKRSRVEEKMVAIESPDESYHTTSVHEITIDDDGEEERERRRRSSLEKKPTAWAVVKEEKKEKRETSEGEEDPYAFDDEDMEEGERPMKGGKIKLNTNRKNPLITRQNGPPKKEKKFVPPTKGSADRKRTKSENVSPSKSAMEQTGGGRRRKEESDEEEEKEKTEVEESDGEKMKEEDDAGRFVHANVTRRSRARSENRERMEKKEEEVEVEMEDVEDDDFFREGNPVAVEAKEEEEPEKENEDEMAEFGSQEGGFIKVGGEEESSADEVVQETPPEDMEQGEGKEEEEGGEKEEKETVEAEEDKTEGELESTDGEEEEDECAEEGKTAIAEEVESPESPEMPDEDVVFGFDSSARHEQGNLSSSRTPATSLESSSTSSLTAVVDETKSQRLTRLVSSISPIKAEETEESKEEEETKEEPSGSDETLEDKDERETKLNEREAKFAKWNETRAKWRELVKDTDAPPPRDHIMFRPVDDRWMRGQCHQFNMPCEIPKDSHEQHPVFASLRAQSGLCKVTTAPDHEDVGEMLGDGNCLFRAIAWWVIGSEEEHSVMRRRIVNFMARFPDEFGQRMSGPEGQKYVKEGNPMLEDGEWGTQCEIYGAATFFGVDIYTYHEGRWKPYRPLFEWSYGDPYKVIRMTDISERTRYGLYLTNDQNLHFDVVRYMEPVAPVSDTCYRLLGTILHKGETACSGHYVADVFDQDADQWLHCDDNNIKKRIPIRVLEEAMKLGYVLVYGKNSSVIKHMKC